MVDAWLLEGERPKAGRICLLCRTSRLITTWRVRILSSFGCSDLQAITAAADICKQKGLQPVGDVDAVTAGGPR